MLNKRPLVALFPWGLLLEDFLAPNHLSLDAFCDEFVGSWMFGYVRALQTVDIDTVIVAVSGWVDQPLRRPHLPTGARILVVPAPLAYREVRRRMVDPYGRSAASAFGVRPGSRPMLNAIRQIAPYLATPTMTLRRELRRMRCDAILSQEYEFPRFDSLVGLGRILGIPVYATFQGGDYQRWHLERRIRPVTVPKARGLIIPGRAERARVRKRYRIPSGRLWAIPNPVDTAVWVPADRVEARRSLGIAEDADVAVWHGRVSIQPKGLDILLEAWSKMRTASHKHQRVLLLVGTGPDREQLRAMIESAGPADVRWIDEYVHDPGRLCQYLSAGDAYVFPSRHEGFPVSPVEAMACSLPVVAADTSGVREILGEGEGAGGVIVPTEDPTNLSLALERVLGDRETRRRLASAARRRVDQRFSLNAVGAQLNEMLGLDAKSHRSSHDG